MSTYAYPLSVDLSSEQIPLTHISLSTKVKFVESNNFANNFTASVIKKKEEKYYVAQCKEIPYVYGQGETEQKALDNLRHGLSDELNIFVNEISLNLEIIYDK